MSSKLKFLFLLIILLFVNLVAVSATDINATDSDYLTNSSQSSIIANDTDVNANKDIKNSSVDANSNDSVAVIKTKPKLSIDSKKLNSRDTLGIIVKDSNNTPLKSKKLTVIINDKTKSIKTNSNGIATLKINLDAKSYNVNVTFSGDDKYKPVSKNFKIKVYKLKSKLIRKSNFLIRGDELRLYLLDKSNQAISGAAVSLNLNGQTYDKRTNKDGKVALKINLYSSKFTVKAKFKGDNKFKSSSNTFKYYIVSAKSLKIENSKLLTHGYLRIYLKDSSKSDYSKKTIKVSVGKYNFSKKTNSEGILVLKPNVKAKHYKVIAKIGKYFVCKYMDCIDGRVLDPLENNITLKNGAPNIDFMPKNYVTGDSSATYTLTKSQYREVLKRDSHCLFLNNKLSKYTFFKTKNHPNLNHIVKREKWNVIERAINLKLVYKNKPGYWPGEITVSLKGKAYTYSEVRDPQDLGYTCGPTSASVCSQVLRNYISEKQLANQAGSNSKIGTKCEWMISALEKNNFICTYFYKKSFDDALNELKIGGCALIFHTKNHYVSILDISKDGKKVLVSNSYGSYYNIPTKWLSVSYMKTRFYKWEDSLIVRLNYDMSKSKMNSVNCFYNSMGTDWARHNTGENILK